MILHIMERGRVPLTMSSREIAELTGKQHAHVLRDIRSMIISLYGEEYVAKTIPEHYRNRHSEYIRQHADEILGKIMGDDPKRVHHPSFHWARDKRGYVSEFSLDKELTYTLIAGYKVKLRNAIVKRWLELEQQTQPHIPTTLPEALRLAAKQAERMATLEPKAAALDAISQAPDDMGVRDAGRELGIGQTRLARTMISRRWACREAGRLKPAHYGLSTGYVRFVSRCYTDTRTGEDRLTDILVLTRKGLTRMAEILAKEGADA
ncbi:Rha family transcriptional regulator [Acetobacteraceae bacterium B3987]|nr:Rha family transcriptional regulator [Acetobacteraceae bacterium B3987]